jgi:hypothetical protein
VKPRRREGEKGRRGEGENGFSIFHFPFSIFILTAEPRLEPPVPLPEITNGKLWKMENRK